jgi:hypothetical protein
MRRALSFKTYINKLSYFTIILVSKGIIPKENQSKVFKLSLDEDLLQNNEAGIFLLEYPLSEEEEILEDILDNILDQTLIEEYIYTSSPLHILSNLIVEDFTRNYSLTNGEKDRLVEQIYDNIDESLYSAILDGDY